MLGADLIHSNNKFVIVKVYEDVITHDFTITEEGVEYLIRKFHGEPIAKSTSEIIAKKEGFDGHIRGMTIRTDTYDFEIVQDENYTFHAYRSKRR